MAEVSNSKSCVICGGTESEGELLVRSPCDRHYVCPNDVSSFFERATQNEGLFPPKCCGQMFMLQEYEDYVPFEIAWPYQVKQQGEYAVLAKFRVYCANPPCAKFLHQSTHVTDPDTKITYALCEDDACGRLTCVGCKYLLHQGTQNHICKKNEDEEKFKQTATKNGYQECSLCGATIELAEACNHITCECGHEFCYICGRDWSGIHGCPHYGPATYDAEGYNQDGYHRNTSLNREGLTRRQEMARRRDEDLDDEDDGEDNDPDWEVLQHLTPDQRVVISTLQGHAREDALDQLRITLFETRGIMFGVGQNPPTPQDGDEQDNEDSDGQDDVQGVHVHASQDAHPALPLFNESDDGDYDIDDDSDARFADDQSEDEPGFRTVDLLTPPILAELNASSTRQQEEQRRPVDPPVSFNLFEALQDQQIRELGDAAGRAGNTNEPGDNSEQSNSSATVSDNTRPATHMDSEPLPEMMDE